MKGSHYDVYCTPGCLGLGVSQVKWARAHAHTDTQRIVTVLSHNHGNAPRLNKDRCSKLYILSWRTEHRSACLFPASSYLDTCCTALTQWHAANLEFPQRWHMYQAEQEMSWVGRDRLPDRCHLQSVQACLRCVNYSINQHIALSGYHHLITSETLAVNGVKCVHLCACMTGHTSQPPWHSHRKSVFFFFFLATETKREQ